MRKINIISDIFSLITPKVCSGCGDKLSLGELTICTSCRMSLPFTYDWKRADNPAFTTLDGLYAIEWAASFGFYRKNSNYAKAIKNMKFKRAKVSAQHLGEWFAYEITTACDNLKDIDYIIPMPIHTLRYLWRGYNQSEEIAKGMAKILQVHIDTKVVKRVKIGRVQSRLSNKKARKQNSENMFKVTDVSKLLGKHILIIDDTLTSGSTMLSLIEVIKRADYNCKISVATLARSDKRSDLNNV